MNALPSERKRPLVVAHRGYHKTAKENTLEAFKAAISVGVDFVEFDVWSTKDGVLVVYHNPSVFSPKPYFLPKESVGIEMIRDMTYEAFMAKCTEMGIVAPTLDKVLDLCRGRCGVDIEIKYPGFESAVVSAVIDADIVKDAVITSFYDEVLRECYRLLPEVKLGLILGMPAVDLTWRLTELFPWNRAELTMARVLIPHYKLLHPFFVYSAHRKGLEVWPWPVNSPKIIKRLIAMGVDAIITDDPETVQRFFPAGELRKQFPDRKE